MIITISGLPGSGKSTVARLLADKLRLKHYSTGDYMRKMAGDRHLTLAQLGQQAEKDKKIDEELDTWQIKLGLTEDNSSLAISKSSSAQRLKKEPNES